MFNYFLPTKFFFGPGSLRKNGGLIEKFGRKFIVVNGKSSGKNGSKTDLITVADGCKFYFTDGCPENPSTDFIDDVIAKTGYDWDGVIGLGGGSPMDSAKAVAALL